jgi:photosystem II stability/assembly factor-like uncharacterized protein/Mg-chelatase subunit ChlD
LRTADALIRALDSANQDLASIDAEIRRLAESAQDTKTLALLDGVTTKCKPDAFQGISFYDGTSYGSLRVFEDRVELFIDSLLSFPIDGTIPHTYRLCGQGVDVNLYIDGQLAVDGAGKFTRPTAVRQIEFGSIAPKGNDLESSWESFRYAVDGCHVPAEVGEMILTEVVSLPDGSIGRMEAHGDALYVTLDPNDPSTSSSVYRYTEGQEDEYRTVLAVTRSNVTAVVVDPSRNGNIFGTTGKFIGTDRGLQYVLGSKPSPFDMSTFMNDLPDESGWQREDNCDGNSASIFGGVLSIDTRPEVGTKFWRYAQRRRQDPWVSKADNDTGWTIEARARIGDDGSATFFENPEDSDATSPYGARDVVIVVAAGSTMADDGKIDVAKRAAELILLQLRRQDRLAVVSFGDATAALDNQMLDATKDNVEAAVEFVRGITATGGASMLAGMTSALAYSMTAPSKIIVLVSDGKTDSNPSTLLSTVKSTNLAGPKADVCVLGLSGSVMAQFPVYKYMLDQLSAQNNGVTTYLQAVDIVDDKVLLFWRGAGGPVYDFEADGAGSSGTIDQGTAFSASEDKTCEPSSAGSDPDRRGLSPPDDGLNAPGIVINDGKYQEVVQFFKNGVRLKYAKLFAPLDMAGRFQTIRVIGKGKAIAVYSKADDEALSRRLIVAPDGLFVRSFEVSSQEKPVVMVDRMGFTHAAWQDTQGGAWRCFYSKTVAAEAVDKGTGISGAGTSFGGDIVRARAAFGLSPAARDNLDGLSDRILVCATASWVTKGVIPGDKVALFGNVSPVVCRVQDVIDEWILVVENCPGTSSTTGFQGADYVIFRGEAWTPPVIVSPQQGDSNNPSIGIFSDGDIYVAYDNDETGQKEIYLTRLKFDPNYVSAKESVRITNTTNRSSRPRMVEVVPSGSSAPVVTPAAPPQQNIEELKAATAAMQTYLDVGVDAGRLGAWPGTPSGNRMAVNLTTGSAPTSSHFARAMELICTGFETIPFPSQCCFPVSDVTGPHVAEPRGRMLLAVARVVANGQADEAVRQGIIASNVLTALRACAPSLPSTAGAASSSSSSGSAPGGSITVAWEEKSSAGTHVLTTRVPLANFGTGDASCYKYKDMTPDSTNARRPVMAPGQIIDGSDCSADFILAYEDDVDGQFDVFVKQVGPGNSVRGTIKLSSGIGDSINPTMGGRDLSYGRIIVAWENNETGNKEVYAAIATCAPTTSGSSNQQSGTFLAFSESTRVTSSRGDSKNPSIAISENRDVSVVFESDRRRSGYPEMYTARLHPTLGWLSSGQGKLDVRVESYSSAKAPAAAYSPDGSLVMLFETNKDGTPSRIARLSFDDNSITIDQSVAGYFPLDDNDGETTVKNRVSGTGAAVGVSRDVVLVVQASDSMASESKFADARIIAESLLGFLDPGDNFTVMTFDSAAALWSTSVAANTPANVFSATAFLNAAAAAGTADIFVGLQAALGVTFAPNEVRSRVVILMSDGLATAGETATGLLTANVRAANQSTKARIFSVGFGASPNTTLLDSLAGDSDGVALYFTQDGDTTAMAVSLANIALSGSSKLPEINGLASATTNTLHVQPADTGASLFSTTDQGAFDLREDGRAFKVDRVLLGETGAAEFIMRPHWPSTDTTERVFFGNGPLDTTSANTMSFGFTAASKLRFRVVDGDGATHQTEVSPSGFQWSDEDSVNFRVSWDAEAIGASTIADVLMLGATTGLACGQGGRIFRTTDGAVTWAAVKTPTTYDLFSLDFVSPTLGFASGELGTILRTTDAGLSWSAIDTGFDEDINSVYFRTTLIGYAAGSDGLVARTADGGGTWTKVVVSAALDFNDITLLRQGITEAVVAVGAGGQIYRSTDDGVSYSQVSPVFAEDPASSWYAAITRTHQAGSYTTYVAGGLGVVLRTTTAGASWESVVIDYGQGYLPNLYAISHGPDSDYVYIVGANGMLGHSFDGGDAWQLCATSVQNGPLTAIDANLSGAGSNLEIFVGGVAGSFLYSTDGGSNQTYSIVRSGNLTIQVNGKEPDQERTGDLPFTWTPSNNDLYFGDYRFSGDRTANAEFDELYVYRDAYPTTGQAFRRRDIYTLQTDNPRLVHDSVVEKRLEWGNVSDRAKASSYWSSIKLAMCGAVEPLWTFAWTTQLGLVDDVIRDLSFDRGGRLWIATENGISSFDAKGASEDIENWLQGLRPIKNSKDKFVNFSNLYDGLPSDSVSSVSIDGDGNVWAGTDAGLLVFPRAASGSNALGTTFSDSGIDPVERERQRVMAEIDGSGTPELNTNPPAASKVFTTADGLPSDKVLVVRALGGNIFVGTDKGLAVLSTAEALASESSTSASGTQVTGILQTGTGLVDNLQNSQSQGVTSTTESASTSSQSSVVSGQSGEALVGNYSVQSFTVKDGLPSNLVRAITQERKTGDIWIGTDKGAARFFPEGSIKYAIANGLPNNDVYSIFLDGGDNKYIGTGFGLARVSGSTVTPFLPSSGLGIGAIQSGAVDSNGVKWMATSLGLVSMDDICPGGPRFARYSFEDGLLGDGRIRDFQFYRMLGGSIPSGGCEKALVSILVNGELQAAAGYKVLPRVGHSPMVVFDEPLQSSDRVDIFVRRNWRKVFDFTGDFRNKGSLAAVEMPAATMFLRRKRFRAGTVTLGGNLAKGAGNPSAKMYAVFVVPVSGAGPVITSVSRPSGALAALDAGKDSQPYVDSVAAIEVIPADVLGAEFIKLFAADNEDQSSEYLEFTTSADVIVYVAYDARAGEQLPSWLRGFEAVKATYRITDMTTFTDASEEEKLFMSVSGTTGCVYDLLHDEDICDISDSIAMDTTGPDGCAKIARTNSATNISLSIEASDLITGVDQMQVSPRSDFVGAQWVPFSPTFNLQLPPGSTNVLTIVPEIVPTGGPTPPLPGFTTNTFFTYNDQVLITSSNPGRVYILDRATNEAALLFDTGETEVLSLVQFGSVLLVGTGTNGKVFKWDGSALTQLTLSAGESITAMEVFDTTAFFGTSPNGRVYAMDDQFVVSLFKDTFETAVTGFAIFGGRLFWTTSNDQVSEGNVLFSTTKAGHRHSFVVPAGAARLPDLNGQTSVADGHFHAVVGGVVQEADGHKHVVNGIKPGKVFRYDLAIGLTTIVHADRDYEMSTIASTSLGGNGLLFAGSHPNGKVLRYIPSKNHFIKSFDTTKDTISKLKLIDDKMYAIAGDDVFFFDGRRWQFIAGTGEDLNDITISGGQVILLGNNKVLATKTAAGQSPIGTNQVCAFVRFRDVAGNITVIRDADGKIGECYNPCVTLGGTAGTTGGGTTGTTGNTSGTTTGTGAGEDPAKALVHRLVEIDENASVTFALDGDEAFLSGDKVEREVGVYLSEPFNGTNSLVQWVSLKWDAAVQAGSSITFAVRSASTLSGIPDATWGAEFSASGVDISSQRGQYLQFRATLIVFQSGVQSPELRKVDIELRTSRAVHYFTTNFVLPDDLRRGILTYNGCINPPITDIVFGINANDTTEFSDYLVISPNKVFEVTPEHQRKALRVGIKLISSPTSVPVVDEFALLFSLANDAIIRLNLVGTPTETVTPPSAGSTRTVFTEQVEGHVHSVTFDSAITDKFEVNGKTSINAGHSHDVVNGVVQNAAGHEHDFDI